MRKLLWDTIKVSSGFKKVTQLGRKVHTPFLIVFNIDSQDFKLGVVASRKVGNAVARNRAKRLMRSAFSEICKDSRSTTVLIAKQEILGARYSDIRASLEKAFAKVKKEPIE
jgi:ribonuclease P protein component